MGILLVYLMTKERTSLSYAVLQTFPHTVQLLKELLYDPASIDLDRFENDEFGISTFREFEARDSGTDLLSMDMATISQRDIIEATLNGESLLAILPTGGGKTFLLRHF